MTRVHDLTPIIIMGLPLLIAVGSVSALERKRYVLAVLMLLVSLAGGVIALVLLTRWGLFDK